MNILKSLACICAVAVATVSSIPAVAMTPKEEASFFAWKQRNWQITNSYSNCNNQEGRDGFYRANVEYNQAQTNGFYTVILTNNSGTKGVALVQVKPEYEMARWFIRFEGSTARIKACGYNQSKYARAKDFGNSTIHHPSYFYNND